MSGFLTCGRLEPPYNPIGLSTTVTQTQYSTFRTTQLLGRLTTRCVGGDVPKKWFTSQIRSRSDGLQTKSNLEMLLIASRISWCCLYKIFYGYPTTPC